ncbi:hypothetical protein ACWDYJ_27940, partial [Streptomyces sp. NPDC003042]
MQSRRAALPLSLLALLASAGCVSAGPQAPVPGPSRGSMPPHGTPDAPDASDGHRAADRRPVQPLPLPLGEVPEPEPTPTPPPAAPPRKTRPAAEPSAKPAPSRRLRALIDTEKLDACGSLQQIFSGGEA